MRLAMGCALGLAGLTTAAGQPPATQVPTFRTGVDLVTVDVSVLDRERRPVRGLSAADFTVLENGQPRSIVAFSAVELPDPPPPSGLAPWLREVGPDVIANNLPRDGRLVVILFDHSVLLVQQPLARRIATANTYLEAPRFDRLPLSASGIIIEGEPNLLSVPDGMFNGLFDVRPTARRRFASSDRVTAFMRVYPRGDDQQPTVVARILDRDARTVLEEPLRGAARRRDERQRSSSDFRLLLPAARLMPGDYLLTLTASLGAATVQRDLRFSVQ